jgi:hypothetical protein
MKKLLIKSVEIVFSYVFFWHVSFFIILKSRDEHISWELYKSYSKFIFSPGLEIPTFIQLFAVVLTVALVVLWWLFGKYRKKSEFQT